ncbi:DUF5688 family protein [Lachnospiraceae bacterium LCP25S3_G4]
MNYQQFARTIENMVTQCVNDTVSVRLHTNKKNNGTIREGLVVMEEGINISPTIYLEEFYERFCEGNSLEDIVNSILALYGEVKLQHAWEGEFLRDFSKAKQNIAYRIINFEDNKELLKDIPYVQFLDLAVVFYVLIEINQIGVATMLIPNEYLEMWGTTIEELQMTAHCNTEKLFPAEFKTMISVIAEMLDMYDENEEKMEEDMLYVLSNKEHSYGAACILYENILKEIGEQLQENYYVLPSSIHEVIIVPESKSPSRKELDEMIEEINTTQVMEEDILSNSAYYYSRKERRILY